MTTRPAMLPIFRIGKYNDLVMRGSIPSLFIFFALLGHVVFDFRVTTYPMA